PESARGSRERLRPDRRRAVEPVHGRLHLAQSQARRTVAPDRRARGPAEPDRADQARVLRADRPLNMTWVPLVFYAAALVAYAWHFAQRSVVAGRTATTLLVAAALSHTFVIGMQTMEVGQVPMAGATPAISTFVWLLALAYLYTEMTTDERAM